VKCVWLAEVGRTYPWCVARKCGAPDSQGVGPNPLTRGDGPVGEPDARVRRRGYRGNGGVRGHESDIEHDQRRPDPTYPSSLTGGWNAQGLALRVASHVERQARELPAGWNRWAVPERDRGRQLPGSLPLAPERR